MRKSGLGRALYYFCSQAQVYVAGILTGSFAMAVYYWFVGAYNPDESLRDAMHLVPAMLVSITIFVLFMVNMGSVQKWYAMAVSFGCLRKNAFLGVFAMNMQIAVESLILFGALVYFFKWDGGTVLLLSIAVLYLAAEGCAQLIGAACWKWGKIAYLAAVVVVTGFIFGVAVTNAVVANNLMNAWWQAAIRTAKPLWMAGALVCAGLFCAAGNMVSCYFIRKLEVKI